MTRRRGQAAIEFLVLLGFMTLVFTAFIVVVEQRTSLAKQQGAQGELVGVAGIIEDEVTIAQKVRPGYERVFELPVLVENQQYNVTLSPPQGPSEVAVSSGEFSHVLFLQVNLTNGSSAAPGRNKIRKDAQGAISISPTNDSAGGQECSPADCSDANTCTADRCIAGTCIHSPLAAGASCDDGNLCTTSDVCAGGACAGSPKTCPIGQACNATTGACEGIACMPGATNVRYAAGAPPGFPAEGANWNALGALSRDATGAYACCGSTTPCMNASGTCLAFGLDPLSQLVCENTGLGAELFRCDAAHDGLLVRNVSAGRAYCCSRSTLSGAYQFNASASASKLESLASAGSCSDGSDNDCSGVKDAQDPGCWNALVNSSCGTGSRYENLTAYPNVSMPGTTRYAYDWRVDGASIARVLMNFDVNGSAGRGATRNYALSGSNGTLGGNAVANPGMELGTGADASGWTEAASASRSSDLAQSGGFSMKHAAPTAAQASIQAISLLPSTSYTLSGRIYNNLSGSNNAYLDMGDASWECTAAATQRGAWQDVACSFTTAAGVTNATVRLVTDGPTIGSNTGSAWFDGIAVSAQEPAWSGAGGYGGSGGYVFDGVDDFINISDPASPTDYTVEAWVKPAATASRSIVVRTSASGPNAQYSHQLRLTAAGTFEHYLWDGAARRVTGTTVAQAGRWYHVVGTAQANGPMRLYVDGREEGAALSIGTPWSGGDRWEVGAGAAGLGAFSGTIDDVRIYSRSLSAAQALALSQNRTNRIVDAELAPAQQWRAYITANNGTADGPTVASNAITVSAGASACPSPESVWIESSCNQFTHMEDLIAFAAGQNFTGADKRLTYDWRQKPSVIPGTPTSITLLQLPFESTAGASRAKDYSSYNHTVTEGGGTASPAWSASGGHLGSGAYTFDGSNDYLQTNSQELQTLSDFTVTAWVRPNAATVSNGGMILWEGAPAGSGWGFGGNSEMHLSIGAFSGGIVGNKASFFLGSALASDTDTLQVSIPYTDTVNWHFLAARVQGLGGTPTADLFLDGTLVDSDTGASAKTDRSAWGTQLRIARPGSSLNGYYFGGGIDDVRIYSRALSAQQIAELSNDRARNLTRQETVANENWQVCVSASNATLELRTLCSTAVTVNGATPVC